MILVVNASVALKWFFHICGNESNADGALAILSGIDEDRIQLVQPPHFVSEVAALLAREKPDGAQENLRDLLDMNCQFSEDSAIYAFAVDLSIRLQDHLFDTSTMLPPCTPPVPSLSPPTGVTTRKRRVTV